jgi:hypothetical protein
MGGQKVLVARADFVLEVLGLPTKFSSLFLLGFHHIQQFGQLGLLLVDRLVQNLLEEGGITISGRLLLLALFGHSVSIFSLLSGGERLAISSMLVSIRVVHAGTPPAGFWLTGDESKGGG